MRELWVGPRFALGHDRQGDIPTLDALGRDLGFKLRVVDPLMCGGEVVTSSRIRQLVLAGRIREAAHLLGRFYSIVGEVVHGDHRGRRLGFSTANLQVQTERIMPPNGVYVGYAWVGGHRYGTVMSIGVRPTFGDNERLLEVHLLDFDGDLYGTDLKVEFSERLRPEVKFDSVQALIAQMHEDKAQAQDILAAEGKAFQGDRHAKSSVPAW
jgi:riboflavin kinase/FMN adenylyltransferase